jgi:hypothetical protein
MPIYICKPAGTDYPGINGMTMFALEPDLDPTTTTSPTFTVLANTSMSLAWITNQGWPSSDAWDAGGSMTCELSVNTAMTNLRARCRIRRMDPVGAATDNGTFTTFQNLTAATVLTFSPAVPTWAGTESCGNRLMIEWQFNNQNLTNNRTFTLILGGTDNEVTSTITENTLHCRQIFIT